VRRARTRQRVTAFTLVEALATLALVAIILPVAMRGVSLATAAAGLARQRLEAVSLAETKMAELALTGAWNDSDLSGDFGQDYPDYRWEAEVMEWSDSLLVQLQVRVVWDRRGGERAVSLTTLVPAGET